MNIFARVKRFLPTILGLLIGVLLIKYDVKNRIDVSLAVLGAGLFAVFSGMHFIWTGYIQMRTDLHPAERKKRKILGPLFVGIGIAILINWATTDM